MVDRGVTRAGRMWHNPEKVEVVAETITGQQQGPVRVELHGNNGLKK